MAIYSTKLNKVVWNLEWDWDRTGTELGRDWDGTEPRQEQKQGQGLKLYEIK